MQQTMRGTSTTLAAAGIPPSASGSRGTSWDFKGPNVSGRQDSSASRSSKNSKSSKSSKLSKNGIPVEYWISSSGVWTERATLTLNKTKQKIYLDILDPDPDLYYQHR